MKLVPDNTNIDFVGKRYIAIVLSAVAVLASLLLFTVVGPNWGIDFTGGTEIHLRFVERTEIGEVRAAIGSVGLPDDAVQSVGGTDSHEYTIRVQNAAFGSEEIRLEVENLLQERFGEGWIDEVRFDAEVGARMTVIYEGQAVPLDRVRTTLSGVQGIDIQEATDDNTFYVKLPGLSAQVEEAIRMSLEGRDFQVLQVDSVGPRVGGDLRRQGFIALGATLVLVLVYVGFRFDVTFAPGAVVALFHDVLITVGIFVLLQREVNISIIGALLTIIGYSLNDTIVVFDRVRENMKKYGRKDLPALVNTSINETLNRTVNTSLTTLAAITAFLLLGGPVIQTFALAMIIGVLVGTYSTVFVASPVILFMQHVKPFLVRLMTASQRSSPERAAGAFEGSTRKGRLGAGGPGEGAEEGAAEGEGRKETDRELFKRTR